MPARRPVIIIDFETFLRMGTFAGNVRLGCGSQWRRGARRYPPASCNSLEAHAETGAARFAAADESAPNSAAHVAHGEADTVLADSAAHNAERAPKTKRSKTKQNNVDPADNRASARAAASASQPKSSQAAASAGSGGEPPKNCMEALGQERFLLDGGDPLPTDRSGFVDAVNAHIDLVRATELMLRGQDEKSTKSLLELLLEMKYGTKHSSNAKPQSPLDRLPAVLRD